MNLSRARLARTTVGMLRSDRREQAPYRVSRRCFVLGAPLVLWGAGCKRPPPEPLVKAGMYGGTPDELSRLWFDVLAACKADDRVRVHELMGSFVMTQPELSSLIGPTQGQALWARYQAMLGSLVNAGAVELVAHVFEKKYDDISVVRVDTLPAAAQADTDRSALLAMSTPIGGGCMAALLARLRDGDLLAPHRRCCGGRGGGRSFHSQHGQAGDAG